MKRKTKMVLIIITVIILAPTFATLVYADEEEYPHICQTKDFAENESFVLEKEENGYNIYLHDNKRYIFINSCIEVPKHTCKNDQIVLFLQKKDGGGRLFTFPKFQLVTF